MKFAQYEQLRELAKCCMPQHHRADVMWMIGHRGDEKLSPGEKRYIRRLRHRYRHQIAAMRKNRERQGETGMNGSCGHDVSAEWEKDPDSLILSFMSLTRMGERCVETGVYCKACRDEYERRGIVLHDHFEEGQWLRGELEDPE